MRHRSTTTTARFNASLPVDHTCGTHEKRAANAPDSATTQATTSDKLYAETVLRRIIPQARPLLDVDAMRADHSH